MAYQHNHNRPRIYFTTDGIDIVVVESPQINAGYEFLPRNVVANRNGSQLDRNLLAIENLLFFYIGGHGAILCAVFSLDGSVGWQILWSTVIVSLFLSAAVIVSLIVIFYKQYFSLIRDGRELRHSLMDNWKWLASRGAFVVMLITISICLLICSTNLLYSHLR